jgi:hypothetical protein
MDKNTKTYSWSNSRGDKLVYTVQLGYLLDASGNDQVNHLGRRISESLSVNGKSVNGYLKALDKNHPLYAKNVRGQYGEYAMMDKDYTACFDIYNQVTQSDEYIAYQNLLKKAHQSRIQYINDAKKIEEMSAMGDI